MGASVRTHLESLVLGTGGATRTMAAGRFHLRAPDATLERHPADSCERAFEVVITARRPLHPINPLHGRKWPVHRVTIRVAYARTAAGGDAAEGVAEQAGPGTLDAIRDRAETDATDLESVLVWHENRAGTDPVICLLHPDGEAREVVLPDRVIAELPYLMTTQASLPGSYAP